MKAKIEPIENLYSVAVEVDGMYVGEVQLRKTPRGIHIYETLVEEDYRGRGYFTEMIKEAIRFYSPEVGIYSVGRSSMSNCIYERWTGRSLNYDQRVDITLDSDGDLHFEVWED